MGLEDDLKAKTLALISQQMANWVVEIQSNIQEHQANLVRTLDELQETVARYDEKINEGDIGLGHGRGRRPANPPAPAGPSYASLKSSLAASREGHEPLRGAHLPGERGLAVRRPRGDVHREGAERDRLVRARPRPARGGQADQRPPQHGHGIPPRPELPSRGARLHRPVPGNGAGAGAAGRRSAGDPGRAPDPARQAGGHPLLRLDTGGGSRVGRGPRRDPGALRRQDDRPPARRRPSPRQRRTSFGHDVGARGRDPRGRRRGPRARGGSPPRPAAPPPPRRRRPRYPMAKAPPP